MGTRTSGLVIILLIIFGAAAFLFAYYYYTFYVLSVNQNLQCQQQLNATNKAPFVMYYSRK